MSLVVPWSACLQGDLIFLLELAERHPQAVRTPTWLLSALEGRSVQLQEDGVMWCLEWPQDKSKQTDERHLQELQDVVKSLVEVRGIWKSLGKTLINKLRLWCEGVEPGQKYSAYPFKTTNRGLLATGVLGPCRQCTSVGTADCWKEHASCRVG
jgi:hypothetical protein